MRFIFFFCKYIYQWSLYIFLSLVSSLTKWFSALDQLNSSFWGKEEASSYPPSKTLWINDTKSRNSRAKVGKCGREEGFNLRDTYSGSFELITLILSSWMQPWQWHKCDLSLFNFLLLCFLHLIMNIDCYVLWSIKGKFMEIRELAHNPDT